MLWKGKADQIWNYKKNKIFQNIIRKYNKY